MRFDSVLLINALSEMLRRHPSRLVPMMLLVASMFMVVGIVHVLVLVPRPRCVVVRF